MNTHTPRAQQHRQVQSLAVLAMFTAILFLLTFTPIGMIDLPIIKATVLHVPVIIGALLLGPKKGAFLGGMILPGLRLSVDALSARAAQLPCITFTQPEGLLGTDTVSCMRSGALYGAAAALEGISLRLEEELGPVTVVLTGGHGRDILPLLRRAVEYEPHLQLMGLRELWLRSL